MEVRSYKDLVVWQKAIDLTVAAYKLIEQFPADEKFALALQIKRAAVSIPSNLAEGSRRGTKKDFRHFVFMAFGSGGELETQITIARKLSFGKETDYVRVTVLLDEVMRMLNKLLSSLDD